MKKLIFILLILLPLLLSLASGCTTYRGGHCGYGYDTYNYNSHR